jgi:phosphopantothenoylcysteine decarboxylase/phosphopantothenate--cysteine ligase
VPSGIDVCHVVSAWDMQRAVQRRFPGTDLLFMVAAVCDMRPARRSRGKPPKAALARSLRLVPNPEFVAGLARRKGRRVVVGFALEPTGSVARGRAKLRRKNLDLIVVNRGSAIGGPRTSAVVLTAAGEHSRVDNVTKTAFARRLVSAALSLWQQQREGSRRSQ